MRLLRETREALVCAETQLGLHRNHPPYRSFLHQSPHLLRHWEISRPHRLLQVHPTLSCRLDHCRGLFCIHRHRLFHQHRFSSLHRSYRHFCMHWVQRCHIYYLYLVILRHLLVRAVRTRYSMLLCKLFRSFLLSSSYCHYFSIYTFQPAKFSSR